MRMNIVSTRDEIAAERQRRYLDLWPLEAQAEAMQDALGGRPAKLAQMQDDFAAIRSALPYPA